MDALEEWITRLARARQIESEYRREIRDLEAELADTPAGRRLAEVRATYLPTACADVTDAEDAVRRQALALFESNGHHKQVHPAVTVKDVIHLQYDPEVALEYARQHLPKALKLDKRAFDKVARVLEPDFVTQTVEHKPYIARDLSAFVDDRAVESAAAPVSAATG